MDNRLYSKPRGRGRSSAQSQRRATSLASAFSKAVGFFHSNTRPSPIANISNTSKEANLRENRRKEVSKRRNRSKSKS